MLSLGISLDPYGVGDGRGCAQAHSHVCEHERACTCSQAHIYMHTCMQTRGKRARQSSKTGDEKIHSRHSSSLGLKKKRWISEVYHSLILKIIQGTPHAKKSSQINVIDKKSKNRAYLLPKIITNVGF